MNTYKPLFYLVCLLPVFSFGQSSLKWTATTDVFMSYYHVDSYAKERPIIALEEVIDFSPFERWKYGLGFGANLYPATLTVPVFLSVKHIKPLRNDLRLSIFQTYGRNLRFGELGFSSSRNYGGLGLSLRLKDGMRVEPKIGYLLNWDKWGGASLSFTLGVGLELSGK